MIKRYSLAVSVGLLVLFFLIVLVSTDPSSDIVRLFEWATRYILPWLFFIAFIVIFGRRK
ncbi:hypothetical protein [Cohnella sp. REN36]|uniref:hypothetical protein n=1 Tax=Cohnella sp. REN36 TaxID=2887347 RepID=UPI001D14F247|nr:hypothetical protein [Cohnella sp. REN36]MCC3377338.1 hypothetical protein [Cohnella sp. REN36]